MILRLHENRETAACRVLTKATTVSPVHYKLSRYAYIRQGGWRYQGLAMAC